MDSFSQSLFYFTVAMIQNRQNVKCQRGTVLLFVLLIYLDGGKVKDGCCGNTEDEASKRNVFQYYRDLFQIVTCSNALSLGKLTYSNKRWH